MGALLSRATRRGTLAQVRHVTPVHPAAARGLVAEVYRQVERDFGMLAPPISLHSPAPDVMAAAWLILRESLLATRRAPRAAKEAVAAAVSVANACPYCADVHSATLSGLVRSRDAMAIGAGRAASVGDPVLRSVASWAAGSAGADGSARHPLAVPDDVMAELAAVAVTFHYLNRMVSVFLPESPIPARVPAGLRGGVRRLVGWTMAPTVRRTRPADAAAKLLPDAPVLPDLPWMASSPGLATAFARAGRTIEAAGERSAPPAVRALVSARLARWDGVPPGISAAWADESVAQLRPQDRPSGRLALLTAFAAYQVGPTVVADFRRAHPEDRALVELTSWASMAAARRIGSWMVTHQRVE
ncbi:carboxymuconolactone decarboxylase family protein [Dactylosporangium sp. NPDC051484]|uniref:carboxymuconolactone decarboxylase family protein n=1 Tax=Dactylosporangium sp. NPDC051484 TaxID=3154942 RepID=UPI00344E2508